MSEVFLRTLQALARDTNALVGPAKWYLFGSAREDSAEAADIDLLIVCKDHRSADRFRQTVDLDQFGRPIHLSILTQAEQDEIDFVENQNCARVL